MLSRLAPPFPRSLFLPKVHVPLPLRRCPLLQSARGGGMWHNLGTPWPRFDAFHCAVFSWGTATADQLSDHWRFVGRVLSTGRACRCGRGVERAWCDAVSVSCRVVSCRCAGFWALARLRFCDRESAVMESYPVGSSVVRTADFEHPPLLAPIELPAAALWGWRYVFAGLIDLAPVL